jgi:hypothetical protein
VGSQDSAVYVSCKIKINSVPQSRPETALGLSIGLTQSFNAAKLNRQITQPSNGVGAAIQERHIFE